MRMLKTIITLVAVATFGFSSMSSAGPVTIMLNDGVNPAVILADGDGTDPNGAAGAVTFIGGIGSWIVNVTTGIGAPIFSTPHLDLNSINVSNTGSPTTFIDLYVSQTDFSLSGLAQLASFYAGIGGTTVGSVVWELLVDDGNSLFSGVAIAGGMNAGTPFSDETTVQTLVDGLFSMTLHVRILHANTAGTTSFDFESFAVPEPGTLVLIGFGLFGLALARRRA